MDTLSNWLAFVALVYFVGVKARWWVGPITAYRRRRTSTGQDRTPTTAAVDGTGHRSRWSRHRTGQDTGPGQDTGTGPVPEVPTSGKESARIVDWAPGVSISYDDDAQRRVRVIRPPTGPRPLEELLCDTAEHATRHNGDRLHNSDTRRFEPAGKATPTEIRAYVRRRLAERPRPAATQIDRDGADVFGCSTKSIQRARLMIERKQRNRRTP